MTSMRRLIAVFALSLTACSGAIGGADERDPEGAPREPVERFDPVDPIDPGAETGPEGPDDAAIDGATSDAGGRESAVDAAPEPPPVAWKGNPAPNAVPVRLYVVIYDPIIESRSGKRLHEVMGWQDPDVLTAGLVRDFAMVSHGTARYQIVGRVQRDEWPIHTNGRRYTDELFLAETAKKTWTLGPGDYAAIVRDNKLAEKVNAGEVDEVFLWGFPGAGWFESVMVGNGAFWINGTPVPGFDTKPFAMMGLNYERGYAEAAESYGHRVESILKRVYGGWAAAEDHDWNRFTLLDRDLAGRGGVGNAHNAFNAEPGTDYNRTSTRALSTSADDWYAFPAMTGKRTTQSCNAWGCSSYGYLKWWYSHMPHAAGFKNGVLNNWWRYILDVSEYKTRFRFPTAGADVTPPKVTLGLASGAVLSGTAARVPAAASDDRVVFRVEYFVDGAFVGADAIAPYVFFLDTTKLSNGTHEIGVQAFDASGNVSSGVKKTVLVRN